MRVCVCACVLVCVWACVRVGVWACEHRCACSLANTHLHLLIVVIGCNACGTQEQNSI